VAVKKGSVSKSPEELTAAAEEILGNGETVTAAGAFALQESYAAVTAGMLTADATLPANGNPLVGGIGNLAGLEAGRRANAAAKGVTERMLVAVTDRSIHLLSLTAMGSTPQKLLMSFDRTNTEVEVKKFGLSRRLHLKDTVSGQEIGLTGSTARFAIGGKADKAVIDALA
jgi:hypothetical protein